MRTSPHMGLRIWNGLEDPYDHEQLADNWAKTDAHDHTPGRGVLIPTEGVALGAVTLELLAAAVVKRLLPTSVVYSETANAAEAVPITPSATRNAFVFASFPTKNTTEKVQFEVKVGGKSVAVPQVSKATDEFVVPLIFPVPANVSWEWKKLAGTFGTVTYANILL